MRLECTNCGQSANLETGENMGWFDIVYNSVDKTVIFMCKDCGKVIEW